MARRLLDGLAEFSGPVYPVNPNHREIGGRPCYPSLSELPGPAELVLVMVPAQRVPSVVAEARCCGAAWLVLFSSGFAETGAGGRRLQEDVLAAARRNGMRVLGPNCQGLIYRPTGLRATFTAAAELPAPGDSGIAYLGQSGAIGGSLLGMAADRGLGLTAWLSLGNQADLTVAEAAGQLCTDPRIEVLACYLEELPPGSEWQELTTRAAAHGKRIVVLRSGRSRAGQRAAAAHTGALVRSGTAFDLLTRESGAVLVEDLDELLDTAVALTRCSCPPGARIGVVTSSGGAGSLAADQAGDHGMRVPEFDAETRAALQPLIPPFGSTANPVDVTAQVIDDSAQFGAVCRTVADCPSVDAVLVVLTTLGGRTATRIAESVRQAAERSGKPVVVAWLYSHDEIRAASQLLRRSGISVVPTVSAALRLLARLRPHGQRRARPLIRGLRPPGTMTGEAAGAHLLDQLGISRPRGQLVTDPEQATAVAEELGDQVVLKVQSPDIAHKSDVGGVLLGVPSGTASAAAHRMLEEVARTAPHARVDGVLVQEVVPPGVELLVGVQGSENGYPPVITVGAGGVAAELHRDVTSALAPVSTGQAVALLRGLRCWPLLAGSRNHPECDVRSAARAISSISHAAAEFGERLAELEINPLIVHRCGATAADLVVFGR